MRRVSLFLLLTATACVAPPQVRYCEQMGTPPGSAEYPHCAAYFDAQEDQFRADRAQCEAQADVVYPPSLYSQGTWAMGFDPWGRPDMVPIQPDWQQNHNLDMIRMQRVVGPCMQAKGWNSGESWMAGRHPVSVVHRSAAPKNKTPATEVPAAHPVPPTLPWQ